MLFHVNVLKSCGAKIDTNPERYLHYIQGLASYTELPNTPKTILLPHYLRQTYRCRVRPDCICFSLSQDHHNLMYLDVDLQYQYTFAAITIPTILYVCLYIRNASQHIP